MKSLFVLAAMLISGSAFAQSATNGVYTKSAECESADGAKISFYIDSELKDPSVQLLVQAPGVDIIVKDAEVKDSEGKTVLSFNLGEGEIVVSVDNSTLQGTITAGSESIAISCRSLE